MHVELLEAKFININIPGLVHFKVLFVILIVHIHVITFIFMTL